ncbi:hypothetical protein SUGI_0412580 [Cryptomeria japonica]|nr:hypothetical protein SUGI_0412580 [Cryptomeria japonica]
MELALKHIKSNHNLLSRTRLELSIKDSNYSAFTGRAAALELLKDFVAMIGPHSSVLIHIISHFTEELQIPFVLSFAVRDFTLTSYEYSIFYPDDSQLFSSNACNCCYSGYYVWREVVAVYVDNDWQKNGES